MCIGNYIALESVAFPGQYVGVLPDGEAKAPERTTGSEEDAWFVPVIKV